MYAGVPSMLPAAVTADVGEVLTGDVDRRARAAAASARQAEVEDADAAVVAEHHVVRLEVAVGEAGGVGCRESAAGLDEHVQDLAPGAGLVFEPGAEVDAVDEFHGEEQLAADLAGLVDLGDVGVREAGHGLGLAAHAEGAVGVVVEVGAEEFDRDLAVELTVVGGEDDAHGAGADLLEDDIAAEAIAVAGDLERGWVVLRRVIDDGRRIHGAGGRRGEVAQEVAGQRQGAVTREREGRAVARERHRQRGRVAVVRHLGMVATGAVRERAVDGSRVTAVVMGRVRRGCVTGRASRASGSRACGRGRRGRGRSSRTRSRR
jgi:hypothetical protein